MIRLIIDKTRGLRNGRVQKVPMAEIIDLLSISIWDLYMVVFS